MDIRTNGHFEDMPTAGESSYVEDLSFQFNINDSDFFYIKKEVSKLGQYKGELNFVKLWADWLC